MMILWDEPKRQATLDARGLDFAALTPEFFAAAVVRPAKNGRLQAVGRLNGRIVSVVYRPMGREALSVVSMRDANQKERRLL
jgi:uncharacterized DUF497 family protein